MPLLIKRQKTKDKTFFELTPKKPLGDKEIKKRAENMKIIVKSILEDMTDAVEPGAAEDFILTIFGYLTKDHEFPINIQYFTFEINRMKFNKFGALKETSPKLALLIILV